MKPLLHLLFPLLVLGATHVSAICYNPDGSTTSQDVPCSLSHQSNCCHPGWACLSNKLCQNPNAPNDTVAYVRGSCTDKTWRSGNCPNFCVHDTAPWNDSLNKPQHLGKCENTSEDLYYCEDDNVQAVDCAKHSAVVSFVGQPTTVTVIGVTQTAATTAATAPATGSSGSDTSGGSSNSTAVGAGVGVGVGCALLISGAVFFFWRRRRNRRSKAQQPQASQAALSAAGDQGDYYPRKPDQPYEMESTTTGGQTTVRSAYNDHNVVEAPNDAMVGELPAHRESESPVEMPAERV
ncbi:uncharacterized protein TRUGW13939_00283 [Talaromyces rugulosus]|uniref:Mid2 domain-containing protein n=1 Tax=Talaromyces rugulosus TaxID=121627 RepID=A0A7H8QGZ2_TALRU|nr:uncharacterized protein TRUGW13939_00283 [Talaromyces rugulosus]QKX53207.1 hypothetical protein TRUGW13939_00283 [Talaromyces rugulosus]